jgi:hypothetical protein
MKTPNGISLAFCPTGEGGKVDNSCSPANKGEGEETTASPEVVQAFDTGYGNVTPYKKSLMQQRVDAIAKKDVYIALDQSALNKVLKDGEFKTAHVTGESNGYFDRARRERFESAFFGENPVYGYLANPDGSASEASKRYAMNSEPYIDDDVGHYGSVRVKLKDSKRKDTTFTDGDSWDFNHNGVEMLGKTGDNAAPLTFLPSFVDKPNWRSTSPNSSEETYKHDRPIFYIEAQVRGGVKVSDIERVVFFRKDPGVGLQAALKKHNIPWRRKNFDYDVGNE